MHERLSDADLRAAVVVPARPGPLVPLGATGRRRDEVDELLDDVLGKPDERGPGAVDAVLFAGGIGAIAAAQVGSLPAVVTVCGAVAAGLGAVLPARSLWRGAGAARRARRLRSLLGDGVLLRTDSAHLDQLVAAHDRVVGASVSLPAGTQARVRGVAHAALTEVATLLGGRAPTEAAEIEYVLARVGALDELADAVADPRARDGDARRRRVLADARRELENLTGRSSVTDASDLASEVLGIDDA